MLAELLPYFVLTGVVVALAGLSQTTSRHYSAARAASSSVIANRGLARVENKNTAWNPFDFLLVAVLIVFSGIRKFVGTDFAMYFNFHRNMNPQASWLSQIADTPQEPGYTILSIITRAVHPSPYAIFWVAAAITIIPMYAALRSTGYSLPVVLSLYIMLGFYTSSFNLVRQSIASAMIFAGFILFWKKGKKITFAVAAIFATMFHFTALPAALAVVGIDVLQRKINVWRILGVVSACFLLIMAFSWFGVLDSPIGQRYFVYLKPDPSGLGSYLIVAFYVFLLAIVWFLGRTRFSVELFAIVCFGVLVQGLGTQWVVLGRFSLFFLPFIAILLPQAIPVQRSNTKVWTVIFVAALLYFVMTLLFFADLTPYCYLSPDPCKKL